MLVPFKMFFLVAAIMTIPIREGEKGSVLSKGYQEQYANVLSVEDKLGS